MSDEKPNREKEIFLRAAELNPGSQRQAYLEEACGGNTSVRRGSERLVTLYETPGEACDGAKANHYRKLREDRPNEKTRTNERIAIEPEERNLSPV